MNSQAKQVIDLFVKSFFRQHKSLIYSAYRSRAFGSDLHYTIVLKEDNIENRNAIFGFFDKYDLLEISNRYPVYFQFIPARLIDKMSYSEELELK